MKKAIILIALLTVSTYFYGQVNKSILLSFNIGSSVSNLTNTDPAYRHDAYGRYIPIKTDLMDDLLFGFTFNVGGEYFLKKGLSITTSINYEKKGIFFNSDSTYRNDLYNATLIYTIVKKIENHYLTIPITVRMYFLQDKSLFVEAGFYSGLLIGSRRYFKEEKIAYYENGQESLTVFSFQEKDNDNHTTKFDCGLTVGTGYKIALSEKISLSSNLRFNYGLCKIDSKNSNEVIYTPNGIHLTMKTIKNYYGLNSFARNLNMTLTFGIVYELY